MEWVLSFMASDSCNTLYVSATSPTSELCQFFSCSPNMTTLYHNGDFRQQKVISIQHTNIIVKNLTLNCSLREVLFPLQFISACDNRLGFITNSYRNPVYVIYSNRLPSLALTHHNNILSYTNSYSA